MNFIINTKVKNYKGKEFTVSFGKKFKTYYGLEFFLMPSNDPNVEVFKTEMGGFYKPMLECNHLSIGCAVFVVNPIKGENELACYPTDNEYDLDEIYSMVEKGECV